MRRSWDPDHHHFSVTTCHEHSHYTLNVSHTRAISTIYPAEFETCQVNIVAQCGAWYYVWVQVGKNGATAVIGNSIYTILFTLTHVTHQIYAVTLKPVINIIAKCRKSVTGATGWKVICTHHSFETGSSHLRIGAGALVIPRHLLPSRRFLQILPWILMIRYDH